MTRRGQLADLLLQEAQVAGEGLDVGEHERGGVVDLVRDAGGEHPDRGELLGLQAPHLVLALVGGVAQQEHGATVGDGIRAQRVGAALERQAAVDRDAAGAGLARGGGELRAQRRGVEAAAGPVRDLERTRGAEDAQALGERVEGLAQDVAL